MEREALQGNSRWSVEKLEKLVKITIAVSILLVGIALMFFTLVALFPAGLLGVAAIWCVVLGFLILNAQQEKWIKTGLVLGAMTLILGAVILGVWHALPAG